MGLENFSYSHTIGIASFLGRGFMNPVDVRLDSKGILFVLSRSNAGNKDVRISVQTLDSEYMYEFGRWGTGPGQTTQPTAIVLDGDDRVFVPDEFMHNVSIFNREGEFRTPIQPFNVRIPIMTRFRQRISRARARCNLGL